jgi:WD40 repeat protein/tetratricopeptide (TPR) repeat protein
MSAALATVNPFPGLRPFTQEEDYLFFGREEQTIELLQRLGNNRFVAVVGTSGSGKSSLVRCGLLSQLLGGKMLEAGASWEVAVTHPGGNPLALLTDALLEADLYDREQEHARENLLATLSRSHFGLVEAVKQADLGEGTNFLLVVDQFEEIFRFHEAGQMQQEAANEFVSLLLEAAAQKEVPIYVVLTMRSDFIGECGQFEGLAEMVNRGEFLIPRLNREQYKRVIEGPIKVAGGRIAPRLLQRLLNDLGQQADQLPCLQHALMRTWNVWAGNGDTGALDLEDYQRVGKMSQALSLHADEIYESLASDRQRALCQGMFQALTVEESNSRGIRRPQRLGRLCQILEAPAGELVPILDAYRQSGVTFLMPAPEVELTDQTILDISHESLMRVWTRLRQWVEEETQAAGIYHRLSESAHLHERGKAGLYRDPELGIALAWRESKRPNAAWAERYRPGFATTMGFLEASQQASVAEEQSREAARQRELEQAQQLAEAQQLRLEHQQRAARKLRLMIGGLAVVAIVAVLACVAALVSNKRANDLAVVAKQKSDIAVASAADADRERKTALQAQKATEQALTQVASQKAEVESSLTKAEKAEEAGRKLLYTTDMRLAPFIWGDDRTAAQKLRTLLAKHIPESQVTANNNAPPTDKKPDLRGFEWHYYQHLLESSAAVFSGHAVSVVGGVFSSNGQLVTLDQNRQVRHWDLDSQHEDEASRRDLPNPVGSRVAVLSPDGRLAALDEGNKVHVFDTSTGKENFQIDSVGEQGRGLIFTPDSGSLVLIDDKIRWCAAASGQVIASVDRRSSLALPADGQTLAIVGLGFGEAALAAIGTLSADGQTLAVVGHGLTGNQFSIFRLDATAKTVTPQVKDVGTVGTLSAAALSPDGRVLAVGAKLSGSVSVYDTGTGHQIAQQGSAHASPVSAMTFSGDGFKLVTADVEGTIKIWEDARKLASKSAASRTLKGHEAAITHVGFSSAGEQLVSTSADKTARVWDMDHTGAAIRELERSGKSCYVARFSPDGQWIAAADGSSVRLWDAAAGKLVRQLSAGGKGRVYSVAFSPTDNRLLAVGYGGQAGGSYVALWDIDGGRELARLPGATDLPDFSLDENSGVVGALAFSPDGKYLVAGFGSPGLIAPSNYGLSNPPLKVWEVATRRLVRRLSGHTGYCVSLDFSKDGARLASGSRDGTAILWSTETWRATRTLRNADMDSMYSRYNTQPGMVEDVAFSPDGKTLALASWEGTVQFWDVAGGKLLETLKGHSSAVSAVVFSPDGRTLATGGSDQTVRLWNVETGRELMQLDFGNVELGGVETLTFSPDGKQLLAGGKSTAFWSTAPVVWNDPDRAAQKLRPLLQSDADFQSRIRMLSENLHLHAALEKLDSKDVRVSAALAAAQANWHASRQTWPEAALAFDRLRAADPTAPEAWLRTPGLLRLATALVHQNRPRDAAALLTGGAQRRTQDALPAAALQVGVGVNDAATGELLHPPASFRGAKGDVGVDDAATGELLHPLGVTINERLAREPRNPGLLELRAELAGQWSDTKAQVADYTAAIEALSQRTPGPTADLQRLYGRRGNAHVALRQWQHAVDDYARCVTDATTDDALLFNQALALYQIHGDQQAIDQLVERRPKLAGQIGDLIIQDQDKDWPRAVKIYSQGITAETTDVVLLSKRAHAFEARKNWDAAAADWSRAATGNPEGAKLLAEFGRRLAAGGQVALANGQFEKAQAICERSLDEDPENDFVAAELAQLLLDKQEGGSSTRWTVLKPTAMKSAGGATLTLQADGSVLASGVCPDIDAYTVTADSPLKSIGGLRLEALPDASLPGGGPGRAADRNGNFNLGDLQVLVDRGERSDASVAVALSNAAADFSGSGSPVSNAIDRDPYSAWAIFPQQGKPHSAVFGLGTPLENVQYARLRISLHFADQVWKQHTLGRFRLSVCGDRAALEWEEKTFAVQNVTDPWSKLAAAYAMNGRHNEASRYFGRALQRTDGYEARKPILELAAQFDDLLFTLVQRQPDNSELQLALARKLAERGQQHLDAKQPAEARAELQKSREIFTRLRAKYPQPWTVLTPTALKSTGGETFAVENDGSIFVSGPNPDRAVYTLKLRTDLPAVAAIRLETIPDARLPQGGAGRYSNGNFHLAELTASFVSGNEEGKPTPIDISSAIADWQQREIYTPTTIIDGNPYTRWDTYPKSREAHWAVFGLKSPARIDGGYLSITLDSGISSWGQHGLGRFRLSVTNEAESLNWALGQDLKDNEFADLNFALARAYHFLGDQPALDSLLKAHPAAAAGIGDLYAADKNWERAVAEYTKAITPETKDAKLLAKRAAAYELLKQWDRAVADWTRASQQQPDVAFERFKPAGADSWRFYTMNVAAGSMEVVDGTVVFTTTVVTGTGWHVSASQASLQLENGVEYVIRFKMKSPDSCAVELFGVINQENWHSIGLNETFVPPTEFKDYEFAFIPHDVVPGNNLIGFHLGTNRGRVMVKEIVILKAQAAQTYAKALAEAPDQDSRTRILVELAQFHHVFAALRRSLPDDPSIQEAYRRMVEKRAGPNAMASQGLFVALDHHRCGEKDQARLAYRKAVAALRPIGENAIVLELVGKALWEFGPDAPETEQRLAAAIGEPPTALTEAIQNHPDQAAGYLARGNWYGGRGLWRKAADDFTAAYRLQPQVQETMTGMQLGFLLAHVGEAGRYPDHCKDLLERSAKTSKNAVAEWALKTCCLLGPGSVGDPERLARLAEVAASGDPTLPFYEWKLFSRGLYQYRAGRIEDAVTTCRKALSKAKNVGEKALAAAAFAVEAMALHRSGDAEGARRSLAEAKKLIDEKFLVLNGGGLGDGWHDWLAAQLLCREAETLLGNKKEEEPKK